MGMSGCFGVRVGSACLRVPFRPTGPHGWRDAPARWQHVAKLQQGPESGRTRDTDCAAQITALGKYHSCRHLDSDER